MNPETQRLDVPPRSLATDAYFAADRSATTATQSVQQFEVEAPGRVKETPLQYEKAVVEGRRDRPGVAPTMVSFPVFRHKYAVVSRVERNPLPQQRKAKPGDTRPDPSLAGWVHDVNYDFFFNASARALSGNPGEPRLRVHLLFGTGTEGVRHGAFGAVESAAEPILLVVVEGVETTHEIEFYSPADTTTRRKLLANNRWGVGITDATIDAVITQHFTRKVDYAIVVYGAFSTGYLGLQGSIGGSLISLTNLERVIIYDCLYSTLKPVLDRVKAVRPRAHVIAYIVTTGGNDFMPRVAPSLATLALGGNPAWNYVNLMGDVGFHAMTSARLIDEARRPEAQILAPLVSAHESALNGLVSALPVRNMVVSDVGLMRRVKGSIPAGASQLVAFASDKTNASRIRNFFAQISATRRCIGRAQLLGWPTPPGEEWHDMLLVEFAWEYLT